MFCIEKNAFLVMHILIESTTVYSLKESDVGVCYRTFPNGTKDLYCCQGYVINPKKDACMTCPLGTYGTDCKYHCNEGYYGVSCNSSCSCSFQMCNRKYGCIFDYNDPEGRKTKDSTGVVIGCIVIVMLILSVTILLVLWKTGGNIAFIRLNINRALSFFQGQSNSLEMTTNDNYYASVRISTVVENSRPSPMQTSRNRFLRQNINNQHHPFQEGNNKSTISNMHIYSLAKPQINNSSLDEQGFICNIECTSPASVVSSFNDQSGEPEEVAPRDNAIGSQCDKYPFLAEESLNELNKDSIC